MHVAKVAGELRAGCETRCPGCAHRTLSAPASEAQKFDWLQRRLAPWRDCFSPLQAAVGEARWDYREKLRLSAAYSAGAWQFGLIWRDELIAIPDCPVHSRRARALIRLLMRVLPPGREFPLAFFIQAGAQATLVLKSPRRPALDWLSEDFCRQLETIGIEGLWLHLHPAAGRRMFAKKGWHLLYGQPRSFDAFGRIYGPCAFQQLLPFLYQQALAQAADFLAPSAENAIVDLYCGSGATLARWISMGAATAGVELGGEAVECAKYNAPDALILRGKCKDRIPQLREWTQNTNASLLYANPPRTGIEAAVMDWISGEFRPQRLAYLSCSAGTLARDLALLTTSGYRVVEIAPYDFFPQTYHVETLCLLSC